MAEGTGFSTGKVVKLLAPAAEIENAQWEAPVRKETEKQSYHRTKNFRRYTTKAAARNWEIKKAWKTWECEYLQHLENTGRKLITLHVFGVQWGSPSKRTNAVEQEAAQVAGQTSGGGPCLQELKHPN